MQEEFFKRFTFLTDHDKKLLVNIGSIETYKNKVSVIKAGETANRFYYIIDGMIRGSYREESGAERTLFIRPKDTFFAHPGILVGEKISKYTFETIQSTTLLSVSYNKFIELSQQNSAISKLYIEALKENIQIFLFRVELLACHSPEERYETLLKERPELFQKAHHKHLANYLGITPNSLSRIIKRKSTTAN